MRSFCVVLIPLAALMTIVCCGGQTQAQETTAAIQGVKFETTYDAVKDRTKVKLVPVKISGEKDKYHSVHMAPSFSFPGHELRTPAIVEFEIQIVVKRKLLDSDLYVDFLIDGEKLFLSSNRWAVWHPVRGRLWMGEALVFRMPYQTYLKLAKARQAAIRFEGVVFAFDKTQLDVLKTFAKKMTP